MRLAPLFTLVALFALPRGVAAQGARPTAPRPGAPSPATAAPAAGGASLPPPPQVNDPMLAPVPAANKSVSNWEDVLGLIRARSTELRIAYAAVERAEGQSRIALAGALPSLNGTGTLRKELLTRTTTNQFTTPTGTIVQRVETPSPDVVGIAALTLSQPIFAPRAWYGIKTAHMGEDVARMSVEQTKRGIAANVASTVLAVVTAERVAELNRIGLRAALERLDLAARKRALGAATGLDVLRAQQDVEAARATLVSGDESLRQQREALGLALGLSEAVGVSANISLDGMQQTANQICKPAGSIDERADVAVARGQTELANRGVGDVKWQFSPTINAQSTLATTSVASNVAPATTWNIQGVLTIPFWEGGARYGLLRQAESEVDRTENLLVQTRRSVTIEIAQAIRAVSVAESARNVAADARKLAAEVDRLTQAGYLEGQGTSLELVIAAQALRQADITLALREFELVRAHILAILSQANCPF